VTRARKAILIAMCGGLAALGGSPVYCAETLTLSDVWTDAKLYFTSPIRWDTTDWLLFGGSVAAIAAAHQADGNVRRHFASGSNALNGGQDPHSLRDAAPAAAIVVGTWGVANLLGDSAGRTEAYTMIEAALFSAVSAEGLKYAAGRDRPDQTTRVDDWRAGGSSFPSLHATLASAIGTVLAESGSDDYRWVRRILGYGIAGATAYIRVRDNEHWLSDTVAGAAVGAATARFTLNRREARARKWDVSIGPAQGGGVSVGFNMTPY